MFRRNRFKSVLSPLLIRAVRKPYHAARGLANKLLRRLFRDVIEDLESRVAPERILENPFVSAKTLYPLLANQGFYVLPIPAGSHVSKSLEDFPVPPRELWEGYGETENQYLSLGRQHMDSMISILTKSGASVESFSRILDFGCAAARMLRFYPRTETTSELWGVDVKANHIAWCQEYLGPPFFFAATTTFPHLPFEDNYFDLVYCGSVFTHIGDLSDAWFLELRRIVRPQAYLYITIQDKHSLKVLFERYTGAGEPGRLVDMIRRFNEKTSVLSQDYGCFCFEGGRWGGYPVPQVFHDVDYIRRKWSRIATLLSVNPEAYMFQTAVLFQK